MTVAPCFLTPEGDALLKRINRLRLSLTDVLHEIADVSAGRAGQLRIGAAPVFSDDLVFAACNALATEAPDATLIVTVVTNDVLLPALRRGEYELIVSGIPALPFDDLVHEHRCDDEITVFASARHRLAGRKHVTLADVASERWVSTVLNPDEWTAVRGAIDRLGGITQRRIALRTSYLPLRDRMVACSDLIGTISRRYLARIAPPLPLVEIPVPEMMQTRRIGVTYRKGAYLSPLAGRFIELLRANARHGRLQTAASV